MAKSSDVSEFDCSKCDIHFLGLPSFHGKYRIPHSGGVREVNLCSKCLAETDALWSGETKTIVRHIERFFQNYRRIYINNVGVMSTLQ